MDSPFSVSGCCWSHRVNTWTPSDVSPSLQEPSPISGCVHLHTPPTLPNTLLSLLSALDCSPLAANSWTRISCRRCHILAAEIKQPKKTPSFNINIRLCMSERKFQDGKSLLWWKLLSYQSPSQHIEIWSGIWEMGNLLRKDSCNRWYQYQTNTQLLIVPTHLQLCPTFV